MSTALALCLVAIGLIPGMGLAVWRWRVLRVYRRSALQQATLHAGCPHMNFSAVGLSKVSCLHCGPLPLSLSPPAGTANSIYQTAR